MRAPRNYHRSNLHNHVQALISHVLLCVCLSLEEKVLRKRIFVIWGFLSAYLLRVCESMCVCGCVWWCERMCVCVRGCVCEW